MTLNRLCGLVFLSCLLTLFMFSPPAAALDDGQRIAQKPAPVPPKEQKPAAPPASQPAPTGTGTAIGASPELEATKTQPNTEPLPGSVPQLEFSTWDVTKGEAPKSYCGKDEKHIQPCRIDRVLFIGFNNLQRWLDDTDNHLSDLVLVLNGRVMKGLTSRGPEYDSKGLLKGLQFDLKVLNGTGPDHAENREAWNALIPELREGALFQNGTLHVAVANSGKPPYSGGADLAFEIFPGWTWAVIVFVLASLVGFLLLAKKSDIVRDAPSDGGARQSFSLARCQMAWWFFIIMASYCYIWLTLNNHDSLTAGVLILTAISAGTGLAATVIDGGKRDQRGKLQAEQAILNPRVTALPAAIAASPAAGVAVLQTELDAKTKRLAEIATEIAALPSVTGPSQGFLMDILRDESGISFHRFQMAGWTVILGVVFVAAVYSQLTMPDFSATLLGLMGISSGTYIGFKISDAPK